MPPVEEEKGIEENEPLHKSSNEDEKSPLDDAMPVDNDEVNAEKSDKREKNSQKFQRRKLLEEKRNAFTGIQKRGRGKKREKDTMQRIKQFMGTLPSLRNTKVDPTDAREDIQRPTTVRLTKLLDDGDDEDT